MGKRSNKKRRAQDFYPTPAAAVLPLVENAGFNSVRFNTVPTFFYEPCVGDGALIRHLERHGLECVGASDVDPKKGGYDKLDALSPALDQKIPIVTDFIITNPPWTRSILHPMIENFRQICPTWLLIDADWMHTKQAAPHLKYCAKIISVGRVCWFPETKTVGKDNAAWYLFKSQPERTIFINNNYLKTQAK